MATSVNKRMPQSLRSADTRIQSSLSRQVSQVLSRTSQGVVAEENEAQQELEEEPLRCHRQFLPCSSDAASNACDGSRANKSCLEFGGIGGIIGAENNRGSSMKLFLILSCTFAIVALAASQEAPKRDYVPNSETAVAIAEAVFIPVYGKKHIESERPFRASPEDNAWTAAGTLYCAAGKPQTDKLTSCSGGVAVVKISKLDAHIISMIHYK